MFLLVLLGLLWEVSEVLVENLCDGVFESKAVAVDVSAELELQLQVHLTIPILYEAQLSQRHQFQVVYELEGVI